MAALIIIGTIVVLIVIVLFAVNASGGGLPRWQISAWQSDGQGGWRTQPVLTIGNEEYRFATPQEYIYRLQEVQQRYAQVPDADPGNIDEVIYQLDKVKHLFVRHATASADPAGHETAATAVPAAAKQVSDSKGNGVSLKFVPEVGEASKTGFGNLIKSLYSQNSDGCVYWRTELLKAPSGDAIEYATRVFDATWAAAVIQYTKIFRNMKRMDVLPRSVNVAFDEAMSSLERLFSYDLLPPVPKILVPNDTGVPEDPLERVLTIYGYIQKGIDNEEEHQELLHIADRAISAHALRSTILSMSTTETTIVEELPIDFSGLAVMLAAFASMEESRPQFARRCTALALKCAAQVPRDDARFANVATTFEACKLKVPAFSPAPTGTKSVRIAHDGSVKVLDRDAAREFPSGAASGVAQSVAEPKSEAEVLRAVEKSLLGLVGLDGLKPLIAMDVFEFLSAGQSRGRLFWGSSGVGKTEVAQRLAGLREGFPGLSVGAGQVRYVSGVDGKLEVKDLIDSLPARSVLFVDEADKCLDPKAGMVSPAEATQIRHAIITHFQRKPVLWIFLGVFSQMRSDGALTDESLRSTFGDELAHRLDYADWGFPAWTLENLLKAVNSASSRRKLRYDDDAALLLAQYCIKTGGGVRAFDNLETAVIRHMRTTGVNMQSVSLPVARDVLTKRGVQVA